MRKGIIPPYPQSAEIRLANTGFASLNALQRALQNRQRSKEIEKSKIAVGIVKKQYARVNHGRANTFFAECGCLQLRGVSRKKTISRCFDVGAVGHGKNCAIVPYS